jgi:NADPH:quinone reductase-like Zn-dependent oxidoreductase
MRTDKRNPAVHASTVIPAADTMMAMVQDEYGEAEDVLRLEQIDRPEIADGQVLVRVDAAGLDRGVWHAVAGLPYPIRLAGYGLRTPNNRVPGTDVAGRVEAVGATVTGSVPWQATRPAGLEHWTGPGRPVMVEPCRSVHRAFGKVWHEVGLVGTPKGAHAADNRPAGWFAATV